MDLILHGETVLNVRSRAQGRCDSPLTGKGRDEALLLGRKLRQLHGTSSLRFISSPLARCRATAELVAACFGVLGGAITIDPRLAEVALGALECLTQEEIRCRWPDVMRGTTQEDWYFRAPDGERYLDVAYRMADWLRAVEDREDLIVVGHGISSRVLRASYSRLPRERALRLDIDRDAVFRLAGGAITKFSARQQ